MANSCRNCSIDLHRTGASYFGKRKRGEGLQGATPVLIGDIPDGKRADEKRMIDKCYAHNLNKTSTLLLLIGGRIVLQ